MGIKRAGHPGSTRPWSVLFDERPFAQFVQGLLDLLHGVHHEWAIGEDRFAEGRPGDQHEAHRLGVRLHFDTVTLAEDQHAHRFDLLAVRAELPAPSNT